MDPTTEVVEVELSRELLRYVHAANYLPPALSDAAALRAVSPKGSTTLTMPRDMAEAFRSAFTARLAAVGFDANYEVTPEGALLETLIDRFLAK